MNTMACKNEEIANLLPLYAAGTVTGEERASVDQHLADCASCRSELEILSEGAKLVQGYGMEIINGHIRPEQCVEYAHDRRQLDRAAVEGIERHLQVCHRCAEEIALIEDQNREWQQQAERPSTGARWRDALSGWLSGLRWAVLRPALAATAALLIMISGYLIYRQPLPVVVTSTPQFILLKEDMVRGEPGQTKLNRIELTRQHTAFVVDFPFEITTSPGVRYDLEITGSQGKTILTRADIKSKNAYGYFSEKFDRTMFTAGRYVLIIKEIKTDDGSVPRIGRFPFDVIILK
jgi:hypothetical protein